MAQQRKWWGTFDLEPGQWARWIIGPKTFFARALSDEWRFAWKTGEDVLSEKVEFDARASGDEIDDSFESRRYTLQSPGTRLTLNPRLAARPVIVRPETPLYLPPRQKTKLYVSTGVWLAVSLPGEPATELFEIPVFRGSETWFGPSTVEGELCTASVTSARTDSKLLAEVPHRAFTPIDISNKGSDPLEIASLRVPVAMLSLFAGSNARLWTDKITFEREQDESAASLHITSHEELESIADNKLAGPREAAQSGLAHSFSKIFA